MALAIPRGLVPLARDDRHVVVELHLLLDARALRAVLDVEEAARAADEGITALDLMDEGAAGGAACEADGGAACEADGGAACEADGV